MSKPSREIRTLLGENARHVPAWLYVQDQGGGIVTFVGASQQADPHPLRYGSDRTHQLIIGEVIIRPHMVLGTDMKRGAGLGNLVSDAHDVRELLLEGEAVLGDPSRYEE